MNSLSAIALRVGIVEAHVVQLERPSVFFASPGDVNEERDLLISVTEKLCRLYAPSIAPYYWQQVEYPDAAHTWQANIASPADPLCRLTICILGERVGKPLRALADLDPEALSELRSYVEEQGLPISMDGTSDGEGVPLTGTVFELLEALRTRRSGDPVLIFFKGDKAALRDVNAGANRPFGLEAHHRKLRGTRERMPADEQQEYDTQVGWLARLHDSLAIEQEKPVYYFSSLEDLAKIGREAILKQLSGQRAARAEQFPGLGSFGVGAGAVFLGRAGEVERRISDLIAASTGHGAGRPMLVLHGPTGCGKSSFAKAGIAGTIVRAAPTALFRSCLSATITLNDNVRDRFGAKPLSAIAIAVADGTGLTELAQAYQDIGEDLTVESAARLLESALDRQEGKPQLVVICDQAEFLLQRLTTGTLSVRSTELHPGWDEVVAFFDRVSRRNPTFKSYRDKVRPPVWIVFSIPDELTTRAARKRADEIGAVKVRLKPAKDDDVPLSRAEMLLWSDAFQNAQREGGEVLLRPVSPLRGEDIIDIAVESFSRARLPRIDDRFVEKIGREYDALSQREAASPLPIVALFLKRLSDGARELAREAALRADANPEEDFDADTLVIQEEDGRAFGCGSLRDIVRNLGQEALDQFIIEKFGDIDAYIARCEASPSASFPGAGVGALHPEDVRTVVARLLRRLIRVRPLAAEAESEVQRELRTAALGGDELLLARCLRRQRLAYETQLFHFGLVHENLLDWWKPAQSWFAIEADLLKTAARLRIAREAGLTPPPMMAVPLTRLLAAWGSDSTLINEADRELIRATITNAAGTLSPAEKAGAVRNAIAAKDDALALGLIRPPAGIDLQAWIELAPMNANDGAPLLLQALFARNSAVYVALREAGADLRIKDMDGYTPIHELAWQGEAAELEAVLQELGSAQRFRAVNARTRRGEMTPAMAAVVGGVRSNDQANANNAIFHVLRPLIEAGADLGEPGPHGRTVLHYAARYGLDGVVNFIARSPRRKPLLTLTNDEGQTPLHLAAYHGHLSVARRLIEHGDPSQINQPDKVLETRMGGRTPIWSAAAGGHGEVVAYLANAGADVNAGDDQDRRPIHAAAGRGALDVIKALSQAGARLDAEDEYGDTPLHTAAKHGHLSVVRYLRRRLLKAGRSLACLNHRQQTPLHLACDEEHADVALDLIKLNVALEGRDEEGRTPLTTACRRAGRSRGSSDGGDIALALLAAGASAFVADARGRLALHHAASAAELEPLCRALLSHGADRQLNFRNENGDTPLHEAAAYGEPEIVRLLIEAGAKSDIKNVEQRLPVHMAAWRGELENLRLLAEADETRRSLLAQDRDGQTPLHIAARRNEPALLQVLFDCGISVLSRDNKDRFASDVCAYSDHLPTLELILQRVGPSRARSVVLANGVRSAANGGALTTLRALLELGASPQAPDASGRRAVHWAAQGVRPGGVFAKGIELLAKGGADINVKDAEGATALMIAAYVGRADVVRTLLATPSLDVAARDLSGANAMDYASALKAGETQDLLRLLLQPTGAKVSRATFAPTIWDASTSNDSKRIEKILRTGVSADAPNFAFDRPLHFAVRHKSLEALEGLLGAGADPNAENARGETSIFLAAQLAWPPGLAALLKHVKQRREAHRPDRILKWTPSHAACANKAASEQDVLAVMRLLRAFGAPIEGRDDLGRTPAVYAQLHGKRTVAALAARPRLWPW